MRKPLVSVVIATYNSGVYLQEAIDSILRQSVDDLELLVIDDGSTDCTRALVEQIRDDRLHYFWQKNAGQTAAKNHGVSKAAGEFIGFCDGDDYWYPNKLELQLPLFAQSASIGVVYTAADTIDEKGKSLDYIMTAPYRGDVTADLFLRNFVPFGTAVVRRECIDRIGAFDASLSMGIDWDLWLRISAKYQFDFVARPTYAYRIWSGQMSKNWRGRYSSAFRIMDKFVRENPGRIPTNLRRKGYADTFANRARARMGEQPIAAIQDGAKAILLDPLQPYSWKTFGRVVKEAGKLRTSRADSRLVNGSFRALKRTLAPLAARLTQGHPRIFMYHRFSTEPEMRALSASEFRQQMLVLKERCEIRPVSEVLNGQRRHAGKPLAAVTVDDGYADFYTIAFPVLQELEITATIFVTTGFVDRQLFLWPDRIRALLENCKGGTFRLSGFWQNTEVSLRSPEERESVWHRLADQLVFSSVSTREGAITDLATSISVSIDTLDMNPYQAMTWMELKEISKAGFEIADHSFTHACLPTLSDDEVNEDLTKSKALLERKIGTRVLSFAYPNGTRRDCDERLIRVLHRLGYENALLSVPAPARAHRRFEIGRFSGMCSREHFQSLVDGFGIVRQWTDIVRHPSAQTSLQRKAHPL